MPLNYSDEFSYNKEAMLAWFKGEFAAANAIIDALCNHVTQLEGSVPTEYQSVFAAIHRRRLDWIPILQMQKYISVDDIVVELQKAAETVRNRDGDTDIMSIDHQEMKIGNQLDDDDNISHASEISDSCSSQTHPLLERIEICSNHDNCEARLGQIKATEGFTAKEPVRGKMVNVVKGLKLFENVFTNTELSKLNDFVNELRVAGQNGELSGETYVLYNQQVKGNKRELIQFGIPIFGQVKDDEKRHIDPIPALFRGVIEHLIQWKLISENRKPNGCVINFFDEGEHSQPFTTPPHLEQPIFTLLLSESKMAFGRTLMTDNEGNCRGPLILTLQEGSLLIMRGNSADIARHVMCASSNKRVSITFFRVQSKTKNGMSEVPHSGRAISLRQPVMSTPSKQQYVAFDDFNNMSMPKCNILPQPMVMFAPMSPVVMSPTRVPLGGTGVFLPFKGGSRRSSKHLPPRAQKGRFLSLRSSPESKPRHVVDETYCSCPRPI